MPPRSQTSQPLDHVAWLKRSARRRLVAAIACFWLGRMVVSAFFSYYPSTRRWGLWLWPAVFVLAALAAYGAGRLPIWWRCPRCGWPSWVLQPGPKGESRSRCLRCGPSTESLEGHDPDEVARASSQDAGGS